MYLLYIANKNYSSWSLRPWVLMREIGIPFADGSSHTAFRDFSPTGKVPCLTDQDTVVWDSLAISEYLAERHQGIWPADAKARAWARCAASEMHSGFGAVRDHCTMNCGIRVQPNPMSETLKREIGRLEELWNEGLGRFGGPFLAGAAFTAVDAFFAPIAFRIQTYGLEMGPAAAAYAARLLDLPAMREWYTAAIGEIWREPGHEAEAKNAGVWLTDLRAVEI